MSHFNTKLAKARGSAPVFVSIDSLHCQSDSAGSGRTHAGSDPNVSDESTRKQLCSQN